MKTKYLTLSKEERKEARIKFFNTESGKKAKKLLNRSLICSILCILFSIYLIIDAFFNKGNGFDKFYGIAICLIGLAMFIFYFKLRAKIVNNYLVNKKKKK